MAKIEKSGEKEALIRSLLAEYDLDVIQVALAYAECCWQYGVDVTKKWETAVQQRAALHGAYIKGYDEGERDAEMRREGTVRVVRCQDCRHWPERAQGVPREDDMRLPCDELEVDPDWFCWAGERK